MFLPGEPVCSLHCFCQGRQFAHYTVYAVGEGGGRGRVYTVHLTWLFALHFVCQGRQFAGYTVFARGDNSSLTLFLPGAPLYFTLFVPPGEGVEEGRGVCSVHVFARSDNLLVILFLPGAPISPLHCFCQGRQLAWHIVFARGASILRNARG